ncbi:MAG TPA: oxidoreductase [Candidatus Marinimicrobia bacterium]|nr:MAG: oxidoreductase [Candidatus Marinimicrobia bacterium CG1_02_48_14]HCW75539.1 oxidoreductase [Candidatus Neomarinimicrobiota bacterium]
MRQLHEFSTPIDAGLYLPTQCKITQVRQLTPLEKWFEIEMPNGAELGHTPGQFVEVSLLGVGEAPISVSSSPTQKKGRFEICVRNVGMLTSVIQKYQVGDAIGIRGPYGHGYDLDDFRGKDVLIVAGGIGIIPLRSLINYILDCRSEFGKLTILYGAKSPADLLFKDEHSRWRDGKNLDFRCTVDHGDSTWEGNTGVITTLIPDLELELKNTAVAITGPPIMYKFVVMALKSKHLPDQQIFLSLERRMKCGVGKCGHCQINGKYCCQDGPVFCLTEIRKLEEAL